MKLALSTWNEIEERVLQSSAILIPIGSIDQHGPYGLLGTDILCPEAIADAAAEMADILIAPSFSVGNAHHHLAFPGTVSLRPSTMIAAMMDWTASLYQHGFRDLIWLNGHGGNIATIQAAFAEIYGHNSYTTPGGTEPFEGLVCKFYNWGELPGGQSGCQELYPVGDGSHAPASEVAVTYAAYPDQVRDVKMFPQIAPFGSYTDSKDYRADDLTSKP